MMKKIVWLLIILAVLAGITVLIQEKYTTVSERPFVRNGAADIYHPVSGRLEREGYEGEVSLTGTYFTLDRIETIELFFEPNTQSEAKLPKHQASITFSNASEAATAFGISPKCLEIIPQIENADGCLVEGKAQIIVSNFEKYMIGSDGTDHVRLEKVISADSPRAK
jgi:hypothetical protein